jgi:hypothetical protein
MVLLLTLLSPVLPETSTLPWIGELLMKQPAVLLEQMMLPKTATAVSSIWSVQF